MRYTIELYLYDNQWAWVVILRKGKLRYRGDRYYSRHQDAVRAAKATGAMAK